MELTAQASPRPHSSVSAEPPPRVGRRTGGGAVLPPHCHPLAASDLSDVHPRRGAEGRRTARPRLECAVSPVLVGVGLAPGACCSLRGPRRRGSCHTPLCGGGAVSERQVRPWR